MCLRTWPARIGDLAAIGLNWGSLDDFMTFRHLITSEKGGLLVGSIWKKVILRPVLFITDTGLHSQSKSSSYCCSFSPDNIWRPDIEDGEDNPLISHWKLHNPDQNSQYEALHLGLRQSLLSFHWVLYQRRKHLPKTMKQNIWYNQWEDNYCMMYKKSFWYVRPLL